MPSYALDLEFDGRGFAGTAPQPGERTVQAVLRAALQRIDGEEVLTRTAGRLDAGVSARSLVTSCRLRRSWPEPRRLGLALNTHLPADVKVTAVAAVADDWDALAEARGKHYRYRLLHRGSSPAYDERQFWIAGRFDGSVLASLAAALVGEHDLTAFACLRGDASDEADGRRRIFAASWEQEDYHRGQRWTFRIHGSGFLYKQVRGLVGAMVGVARGQETGETFVGAINAGRGHERVGQVAPACGLCLMGTDYDPELQWQPL